MSLHKRLVAGLLRGRLIFACSARGGPGLALTMDDGPHRDNTPRLLDEFERHGVRATFFLIGREVERFPEITRRIHQAGHQVANHGYSHLNARKVPLGRYIGDIERGQEALEQVLGRPVPRYVRPPYGSLTAPSLAALLIKRYRIVLWSFDTLDSSISVPASLLARTRGHAFRPGDIVLAHDDYAHTVEAMPSLLAALLAQGHGLYTVSELCSPRPVPADAGHALSLDVD